MPKRKWDEKKFPHAPDVLERETAEKGFSAGWGLHQTPAETYILDCHTHMAKKTAPALKKTLDAYFERAGAHRLRRLVAMDGNEENAAAFSKASAARS